MSLNRRQRRKGRMKQGWRKMAIFLNLRFLLFNLFLLCISAAAHACTVPVFRYALDRWPAEMGLEAPRGLLTEPLATMLRNLGGNSR